LLTGTLVQNSLDEVLTLLSLSNPALFKNASFSKHYVNPIMRGRQPGATDAQVALANQKIADLGLITSKIILKRDNSLLAAHLPPKALLFVFLEPSTLQRRLYQEIAAVGIDGAVNKGAGVVLTVLQTLMKLTTHPALTSQGTGAPVEAAPKIVALLEVISGALALNERVVVISNFTQTLGIVGEILKTRNTGFLQLDGKLGAKKRQELVNRFNAPSNREFPVFLLSSLAAGCGLNIIGASRLVMLDASWNPANDAQAMARIWREGQPKKCYIYRFIVVGTIDERIIQRQLFKNSLKAAVDGEATEEAVEEGEARELMKFTDVVDTCDIHDKFLECECGGHTAEDGDVAVDEDDLSTWIHERSMGRHQKEFLVKAAKFIIHCTIDLKAK
jgi:DNA repair and recombination RAD54-like protein